ncbi:MAG: hypothetical protein AAB778_03185 [Patescibacteria group bacterium]
MEVLVLKKCWKGRLTGLKAVDINARIARGEQCPNDGDEVWVEDTEADSYKKDAASLCGSCSLCGLKPTEEDFKYVDDR